MEPRFKAELSVLPRSHVDAADGADAADTADKVFRLLNFGLWRFFLKGAEGRGLSRLGWLDSYGERKSEGSGGIFRRLLGREFGDSVVMRVLGAVGSCVSRALIPKLSGLHQQAGVIAACGWVFASGLPFGASEHF